MNEFDFGPLTCYIEDENITDINYNGKHLWIDHLTKGRYCEYFDEDDFIKQVFVASNHDYVMFISTEGKAYYINTCKIR